MSKYARDIQYWGWFLAFGIALLQLGIIAVVRSVTATIVSMVFFGWLLLFASGIEIAQAVMVGHLVAQLCAAVLADESTFLSAEYACLHRAPLII